MLIFFHYYSQERPVSKAHPGSRGVAGTSRGTHRSAPYVRHHLFPLWIFFFFNFFIKFHQNVIKKKINKNIVFVCVPQAPLPGD